MNQTNPRLIYFVIGSAIFMSVMFLLTLGLQLLFFPNQEVNDKVFNAFVTAGSSVLSFLFGTLVNTRSTPDSTKTESTVTTTTQPTIQALASIEPLPVTVHQPPGDSVPIHEVGK